MSPKSIEHDPQLLKGILGMLILQLLSKQESYGYEIATSLHQLGLASINEGTIYPALSRLEREGLLKSRLVPSQSGPARKYYRLSSDGELQLERSITAWRELSGVVSSAINKR